MLVHRFGLRPFLPFLATALLVFCLIRDTQAQGNLLADPGFEQNSATNVPAGWESWAKNPGSVTFEGDHQVFHSGHASLKVVNTGDSDWSVGQSGFIPVEAGDVYRFSGWIKCDSGIAQISLHTTDSAGNTLNWLAAQAPTSGTHDWLYFARNYTIPAGCAAIQYRLTGFTAGTTWLDDTSLIRLGNIHDTALNPAPALKAFEVPSAGYTLERNAASVSITVASVRLYCDLNTGLWYVRWPGGTSLSGLSCQAKLTDGDNLLATEYASHRCSAADVSPINDGFGKGIKVIVHHTVPGRPELRQIFRIYLDKPYLIAQLDIVSSSSVSLNNISPLVCDDEITPGAGAHLDAGNWLRTLYIPEDNAWWHPCSSACPNYSEEVTAIFDNQSRHGIVLGSVSHDLWRTGIEMDHPGLASMGVLRVFGGAHDTDNTQLETGYVNGNIVASPLVFVGSFSDWRDGMEAYGRANAITHPPLPWSGGVPVGWNSWSAYNNSTLSYSGYMSASESLKSLLQPNGYGNRGVVYVNLDGGWTNLSDSQLRDAVKQIHAKGQLAGTLFVPFATWGLDDHIQGTPYTWRDLVLKDDSGNPVESGGVYAADPTNPGVLENIDNGLKWIIDIGFDFIKIDWLSYGTKEGRHYDPKITTGMEAYNFGMKHIIADLDPKKIGRSIFISLASSPRFSGGFGHNRGLSSDANFGTLDSTENMLNGLTYGWWQSEMYGYNDADITNVYQCIDKPVLSEGEARTRVNATVIAGSPLLNGDNLTDPQAQQRALKYLTNPNILDLERSARSFRPVEGDTDDHPSDLFTRNDVAAGKFYVAAFNFSQSDAQKRIDLARLGLSPSQVYLVRDLWTGHTTRAQGVFFLDLAPSDSTILCLTMSGK